jgi:hypothetical protein
LWIAVAGLSKINQESTEWNKVELRPRTKTDRPQKLNLDYDEETPGDEANKQVEVKTKKKTTLKVGKKWRKEKEDKTKGDQANFRGGVNPHKDYLPIKQPPDKKKKTEKSKQPADKKKNIKKVTVTISDDPKHSEALLISKQPAPIKTTDISLTTNKSKASPLHLRRLKILPKGWITDGVTGISRKHPRRKWVTRIYHGSWQ